MNPAVSIDVDVMRTHANHIRLMLDTLKLLGTLVRTLSPEAATTLRDPNDGAKGWTVTEVLCHLRDYDEIFWARAVMIREQAYPTLPIYNHEQLVIDRNYNGQAIQTVYAELAASRQRFIRFFQSLSEAEFNRAGMHRERGRFTLNDALIQVGLHDVLHMEQIARIIAQ
jgi:uncharacterized damage-inducible protein DinB